MKGQRPGRIGRGNFVERSRDRIPASPSWSAPGSGRPKGTFIFALACFCLTSSLHGLPAVSALQGESQGNSLLKPAVTGFLKYLLFTEEAPLSGRIRGASDFTKWFETQGPKDSQGRSLRQFDLQTCLFKYPCSYMIYLEAFDNLPRDVKLMIYHRLWKILTGEDTTPEFQKIPAATRQTILQILTETKPDVPLYWKL